MSFSQIQKESRKKVEKKVKILEDMLREDYSKYVEVGATEESALEDRRSGSASDTIECILEKNRKGNCHSTTEELLNTGKQKVGVKRRNPEASKGDIPMLEKARLSSDKNPVMEKEKYKKAND
jgi:hypothetical protein